MSIVHRVSQFVCVAVMLLSASLVHAADAITVADILSEGGSPLTEEQSDILGKVKLGADGSAFMAMNNVFSQEQTKILKEKLGVQQGFNGGPEQPRFLFFIVLFENEGCHFTDEQLKQLSELPDGREGFEKMQTIFTESQGEILQSMFNR